MKPGYAKFLESWRKSLASVLTQVTSQTWTAEAAEELTLDDAVQVHLALTKGLTGEVGFSVPSTHALLLAGAFMSEAPQDAWSSAGQETIEEFLRQCAGYVASDIKSSHGEVSFTTQPASTIPLDGELSRIRLRSASAEVVLGFAMSDTLRQLLDPVAGPSASPPQVRNLDLLMDVELAVTLRFGERLMPLREILELQSGSVIELDRQVQEPVDLLLNGSIIARGNVVVVDGSYGLRVLEVTQTQAALA